MSKLKTTEKKLRKARKLSNDALVGMGWDLVAGYADEDPWAVAVFHELRERLKDCPWNKGRNPRRG